jgi:hypothetical protein
MILDWGCVIRVTQMLLFSIFNSSLFGSLSDSGIHRFNSNPKELKNIQNFIIELMIDNKDKLLSIQNICKVVHKNYGCEVGNFYSPIVVMNTVKEILKKHPKIE